jgi:O-acetyl-ADP-ribose deacetylase (regulator of RNase III)
MIKIKNTTLQLFRGDITTLKVDAIVNAANNELWMGGGVAGAIKRRGGQVIEDEAVAKGPIPIGEAVATSAGKLDARYVIHAAGMGMDFRTDEKKIRDSTKNSLLRAEELGIKSIAFPAIGTGVGGFPADEAARIMLLVTREHIEKGTSLEKVIFALYDGETYRAFERKLKEL